MQALADAIAKSGGTPLAVARDGRLVYARGLGYADVASMAGGFGRWKDEGRAWITPAVLTPDQRNRYHRHVLLPEVGEAGQQKLLESKILLLGAGGLGSPAALYLAAAGVGTLGIVDMDVVDASNLQRQILHNVDRIGERKVDSAKKTLTELNPDVDVVTLLFTPFRPFLPAGFFRRRALTDVGLNDENWLFDSIELELCLRLACDFGIRSFPHKVVECRVPALQHDGLARSVTGALQAAH